MNLLRDLFSDLRYGARALRRTPGFTALVVLSLALGIGANASIFSLGNALFLRTLPVRDPGSLVFLSDPSISGAMDGVPRGNLGLFQQRLYERVREHNRGRSFEDLAAQDSSSSRDFVRLGAVAEETSDDRATRRSVSANYFDVLGVPAFRGRIFLPEDARGPEDPTVVVLSHGYWQRRFGGDPALVGARLHVGRKVFTVVGIAAPGFTGLEVGGATDLWIPVNSRPQPPTEFRREDRWLWVVGRLKPGVSPLTAQAAANVTLQQYLGEDATFASDQAARQAIHIQVQAAATGASALREGFRDPLLALMAGVGLLLLIVCLNVSHLLLARAIHREREIQIRTALGASRWRLVRQLLAEGMLLALLGGAAGALVTGWLSDALLALASGSNTPLALDAGVDRRVLAFIAVLVIGIAVVMGLTPAWQAGRASLQPSLRAVAPAVTSSGPRRLLSRILLSSQVAFSLVLLVGAALLAGSLGRLRAADKGFDEESLLLVNTTAALADLAGERATAVNEEILRQVRALPEVRSASLSALAPLGGGRTTEAILTAGSTSGTLVRLLTVTPGYFDTMGMKLAGGRVFTAGDGAGAPKVAVVNEALARTVFRDRRAVGETFRFDPAISPSQPPDTLQVVGVVRDAKNAGIREPAEPMAYLVAAQRTPGLLNHLQVRTASDPAAAIERVRQAARAAHPDLRVIAVRTMRTMVERLLVQERLLATLSTAFGLAALFLMSLGLYGVVSQWAGQRTREIGVRMALGATGAGVRWMVLRQALLLVLAGVAIGAPAALAASRMLRGLLFGVSPLHPVPLVLASLMLFTVATLAAYLPARRASRVDPMTALRSE
jgi:predicted permease